MGSMVLLRTKPSEETRTETFDFISKLAIGETIASADSEVSVWSGTDLTPSAVLSGSPSVSGTKVLQNLAGGEDGTIYKVVAQATTSTGQILRLTGYLPVVDEVLSGLAPGAGLGSQGIAYGFVGEKSATILAPILGDHVTLLYTSARVRVSQLSVILVGGTTPSVDFTVYYGSSRASGTEINTGGFTADSVGLGTLITSFTSATVPAGNWIWVELSGVTGTPTEFHVTITF